MTAVNKALDWITKMAFLNVLWLVFLIPGLGLFGIFPSTSAMFTVIHKWLKGETDIPVFQTFWRTYKKEFVQSNKLGYLLAIVAYILYLDFVFLTSASSEVALLLTIPYVITTIIFILTSFYVFPIFIHYDMKALQVIKSALFMVFLNPMQTIVMMIGTVGVGYVLWYFQGLALFFSFSVLALIIMMPAHRAFERMKIKQRLYLQTSN